MTSPLALPIVLPCLMEDSGHRQRVHGKPSNHLIQAEFNYYIYSLFYIYSFTFSSKIGFTTTNIIKMFLNYYSTFTYIQKTVIFPIGPPMTDICFFWWGWFWMAVLRNLYCHLTVAFISSSIFFYLLCVRTGAEVLFPASGYSHTWGVSIHRFHRFCPFIWHEQEKVEVRIVLFCLVTDRKV
jgi:hypothetical protein